MGWDGLLCQRDCGGDFEGSTIYDENLLVMPLQIGSVFFSERLY